MIAEKISKMGDRVNPRDMVFEYMVPASSWSEDNDCHYLRIDLPGFNKEEVRLRADEYGHIIVSGERQVNDNKIIHFQQSFKVPENSDIEETSANFEDDRIYCVTIPKKVGKASTSVNDSNNNSFRRDEEEQESRDAKKSSFIKTISRTSSRKNDDDEKQEFHDAKSCSKRTPVLAALVIVLLVIVFVPVVLRLGSH